MMSLIVDMEWIGRIFRELISFKREQLVSKSALGWPSLSHAARTNSKIL